MLASTAPTPPTGPGWVYEPKLDGWRALIFVVDGKVTVRSRNGHDITAAVPEVSGIEAHLPHHVAVLDGELVAGQGRSADFYPLSARMGSRKPWTVAEKQRIAPATFVAFDVLHLDEPTTQLSYVERRATLDALGLLGPAWATVPHLDGDLNDIIAACERIGLEGIVAKRRTAAYRPGERTRHWVKVKTLTWRTEHAPRRRSLQLPPTST